METERLRFDPLTLAHVDALLDLNSDPEVMRYISGRPSTRADVEDVVRKRIGHRWAAYTRSGGEFVGWFGMKPTATRVYELGYRLRRTFWGQGLATEGSRRLIDLAFTKLDADLVWAGTMTVNEGSRHVMEKCGLRHVRTLHLDWDERIEGDEFGDVEYELRRDDYAERFVLGLIETRARNELTQLAEAGDLQILGTAVNGARIDTRVQAADGRAWLVVAFLGDGSPPKAANLAVYPRPPEYDAERTGAVVVLNGPSSVGKSSLMRAFVEQATVPWAYLDEPFFGQLPTRYLAWLDTAGPTIAGFLAALAASARASNRLIVSSGGIDQERFRAALGDVPTFYVGLDAPLEVLIERQRTQLDKYGGLAEDSTHIHDGWTYDLRIDTTAYTPESAAEALEALIALHHSSA